MYIQSLKYIVAPFQVMNASFYINNSINNTYNIHVHVHLS